MISSPEDSVDVIHSKVSNVDLGAKNRNSEDVNKYDPSNFCFTCGRPGEKCSKCRVQDPEVLSLNSFQEGPKKKRPRPSFICSIHCKYDIVRQIAAKLGMRESVENWNVYWSDFTINCERVKNMKRYQKVNHFPGMTEICRKDLLARNLNRMYKLFPFEYNFFPHTWILPSDYTELMEFAKNHKNQTYISKPDFGCKGKGIALMKNPRSMNGVERTICQLYISKPHLIDGFKYDLRVYALMTSCDPLRLYVYNEGLVRFATKQYEEPNRANLTNMYMHLTNYSVNKFSRTYIMDPNKGSKRKLSTLNENLRKDDWDVRRMWKDIDDVIIKTIYLALPTLQHSYRAAAPKQSNGRTCFEILGFDLMLDHRLKPYLLEVNHSPSFHTDAPIDRDVKEALLLDTFRILDLAKNNKNKIIREERKKVTDRLLKDLAPNDSWNKCGDYSSEEIKRQDLFELENKGNFRRIYPGENTEKYNKFFCQGTSSLFNDTFASRAREKATKSDFDIQEVKNLDENILKNRSMGQLVKDKSLEWIFNKMKDEKLEIISETSEELQLNKNEAKQEDKDTKEVKKEGERDSGKETVRQTTVNRKFFVNSAYEEKRISRFHEKQELLESVNVLEKVHKTMKTIGEMKIRSDIQKVRKNKWAQGERNPDKRISLQNSLSDVIQQIGTKNRQELIYEEGS